AAEHRGRGNGGAECRPRDRAAKRRHPLRDALRPVRLRPRLLRRGRRRVVIRLTTLFALLAVAGCSVEIARLAAISADPADDARESLGYREGQVCRWWLLGVPLGLPTID